MRRRAPARSPAAAPAPSETALAAAGNEEDLLVASSPARAEDEASAASKQRRHPRRLERLRVRFFRPSTSGRGVDFSASLDTRDISVGGAYVQSSYFLRPGTKLEAELMLPGAGSAVRVSTEVVHLISGAGGAGGTGTAGHNGKPSGFGCRFLTFHGDSEIVLRAFLARGDMHDFVKKFIEANHLAASEAPRLIELLVRWEIHQETLRERV